MCLADLVVQIGGKYVTDLFIEDIFITGPIQTHKWQSAGGTAFIPFAVRNRGLWRLLKKDVIKETKTSPDVLKVRVSLQMCNL